MNQIHETYEKLLNAYGPQGWWPLLNHSGMNPTKTGASTGYHPGDYSFPKTDEERFEICLGAILTQNTAWPNVEKALVLLKQINAIHSLRLLTLPDETLKNAIRPAGYFNQKAKKLRIFSEFYSGLNKRTPTREALLNLWGIGPETADSILLYAYHVPTFVVDAYTRRIFSACGYFAHDLTYDETKQFFEERLTPNASLFQEFHALIVEHAKRAYQKKPYEKDALLSLTLK